jgi:DNA-binding NarL/FixJ family response regulator
MNLRVVIADNYAIFRAGIARFLVIEDDFRIVGQCDDLPRLYKTVESSNGTIVIFASSLAPSLSELVERGRENNIRFVAVLDKLESPQPYLRHNIEGIIYRDVSQVEALRCLRTVGGGKQYIQQAGKGPSEHLDSDMVGQRARERLSNKELQIIGLVVQGYKNKDIAEELSNSEQVIKNYLRSIFDKTGVSDRLELALFTLHHRTLLDAVGGSVGGPIGVPSRLAQIAQLG